MSLIGLKIDTSLGVKFTPYVYALYLRQVPSTLISYTLNPFGKLLSVLIPRAQFHSYSIKFSDCVHIWQSNYEYHLNYNRHILPMTHEFGCEQQATGHFLNNKYCYNVNNHYASGGHFHFDIELASPLMMFFQDDLIWKSVFYWLFVIILLLRFTAEWWLAYFKGTLCDFFIFSLFLENFIFHFHLSTATDPIPPGTDGVVHKIEPSCRCSLCSSWCVPVWPRMMSPVNHGLWLYYRFCDFFSFRNDDCISSLCLYDMIKGNESYVANIDFELYAKTDDTFLCFTLFWNSKNCSYLLNQMSDCNGVWIKM